MSIYQRYTFSADGTALASNDDFASAAIGVTIEKNTGEVYVKAAAGIFNKVSRKVLSMTESDARYVNVDGDTALSGIIRPSTNNGCTLGASAQRFQTVYATTFDGTATAAKYADLAEKYLTDKEYPIGTVLEVGGDKEATIYNGGALAGVVSGNPGFKLNKDAGDDYQYVALKGKIPVFCIGDVKKGQYCVAKQDGKVQGVDKAAIVNTLDIVGVALEDSKDGSVMVKV